MTYLLSNTAGTERKKITAHPMHILYVVAENIFDVLESSI
jgi:hypothetical protein